MIINCSQIATTYLMEKASHLQQQKYLYPVRRNIRENEKLPPSPTLSITQGDSFFIMEIWNT